MSKWEIVFKLGQVNKCLDYELSPSYTGWNIWEAQIKHLYGLRDDLLRELRTYRQVDPVKEASAKHRRTFGMLPT
jgi:hypothetical protein